MNTKIWNLKTIRGMNVEVIVNFDNGDFTLKFKGIESLHPKEKNYLRSETYREDLEYYFYNSFYDGQEILLMANESGNFYLAI
jgi:hypothetical protein